MRYSGGKFRQSKVFVPIINKVRDSYEYYVEPFCGGCNIIDKISGKRIASDVHPFLIAMWKALQQGWIPPTSLSEEEYNNIKANKDDYPPELVAFAGFACFGAKYYGGYPRDRNGNRNQFGELKKSLLFQIQKLNDVKFVCSLYENLIIPSNSLVYCDPPYKTAKSINYNIKFDSDKFYDWCREQSKSHLVLISEYLMPDDFVEVGRHISSISIHKNNRYQTDILYVHENNRGLVC